MINEVLWSSIRMPFRSFHFEKHAHNEWDSQLLIDTLVIPYSHVN